MATPQALPSGKPRKSTSQSLITPNTLSVWARAGRTHRYPCGDGLYFQTKPNSATWIFRFRFGVARRAMGLGAFPEVGLAVAREKADRARLALREGRDPIAEREAATQAQAPKLLAKWVERKWPSHLFPAEVTSPLPELWQENDALRRKVTVLEQALAQQRPMAKAERQEGLTMTVLKRAITKPNGGVVGFTDANFEFHEAECPPRYPLSRISPRVPPDARPAILEKWEETLPDKEVRMALERLATDRRKMDGVWEKLRNVKGVAEIIPLAIDTLKMDARLRLPPQSKRREQRYQQHVAKLSINHPHPTARLPTCATAANYLRYELESLQRVLAPTGDKEWSRYWRGDPAMNSMGAAINFLAALQDCVTAINDEHRSDLNKFPQVVRWDDDLRARQQFFARTMCDKMRELCRRPRCDVVATLVCVAFNVDVTTKIVREWVRNWRGDWDRSAGRRDRCRGVESRVESAPTAAAQTE